MDSYNKKEFETMQQEAIRRVKEMQKRSLSYVSNSSDNENKTAQTNQNQHTDNVKQEPKAIQENKQGVQGNQNHYNNYSESNNKTTYNQNQTNNQNFNRMNSFNRNNHFYPYGYPSYNSRNNNYYNNSYARNNYYNNTNQVRKPTDGKQNAPVPPVQENKQIPPTPEYVNRANYYQHYQNRYNNYRNGGLSGMFQGLNPLQGLIKKPLSGISQFLGSNSGGFNKFKQMFSISPNKHTEGQESNDTHEDDKDNGKEKKPLENLLGGFLKDFNIDNEKIMLGILIYLLYKNGSDKKLLLALGYLLL